MRDQELIGLYEAYLDVYEQEITLKGTGPRLGGNPYADPDESKSGGKIKGRRMKGVIRKEEVEIASHYFCEMGLNEIGVQILIEELGVEEFAEFVYDISEDYYLSEARAGGVKIEPVTTKGKPFKGGKPTGNSLARLRAQKEKKRAGEASERPSGMKASLQRQDAMVSASKQQPKKKGALGSIADVALRALKRHNDATAGMGAATKETVGKIGKAARSFAKGFTEETDLYDIILSHLIDEGYADTEDAAESIMVNMSEEWREDILTEVSQDEFRAGMMNAAKKMPSSVHTPSRDQLFGSKEERSKVKPPKGVVDPGSTTSANIRKSSPTSKTYG